MNQNEIQLLDTLQRLIVAVERCELNGTRATDTFMFNIAKDLVKNLKDKEQRAEYITNFVLPEGRNRIGFQSSKEAPRFDLLDGIESLTGNRAP